MNWPQYWIVTQPVTSSNRIQPIVVTQKCQMLQYHPISGIQAHFWYRQAPFLCLLPLSRHPFLFLSPHLLHFCSPSSDLSDCYEKWLSIRLWAIPLRDPFIETTFTLTALRHKPSQREHRHPSVHTRLWGGNFTEIRLISHGCMLSRQSPALTTEMQTKTNEGTLHHTPWSGPFSLLFVLNKVNLSEYWQSCPRQREVRLGSPLQRALLPTHCTSPHDIVAMHCSPEQHRLSS